MSNRANFCMLKRHEWRISGHQADALQKPLAEVLWLDNCLE